jgi:hypothetical protein
MAAFKEEKVNEETGIERKKRISVSLFTGEYSNKMKCHKNYKRRCISFGQQKSCKWCAS